MIDTICQSDNIPFTRLIVQAAKMGRLFIGCDISEEYVDIARTRLLRERCTP